MLHLNRLLRNYFGFSNLEARGFWVWSFIMVFLLGLNGYFGYLPLPARATSGQAREDLDKILAKLKVSQANNNTSTKADLAYPTEVERFNFNPNTASEEELKKLGIPAYVAKSMLKYREKGGKYRQKSDLQKIYNFPESLYQDLLPYIDLPAESEKKAKAYTKKQIAPFNLNTADTATLSQIRGIGSKTALNILKYREKLGGFVHTNQLNEVYYLQDKPQIVADIAQYAQIDLAQIRKIKIKHATQEQLFAHPYFRDIAKSLLAYRTEAGKTLTATDLQKQPFIKPEKWEKIKYYLDFE